MPLDTTGERAPAPVVRAAPAYDFYAGSVPAVAAHPAAEPVPQGRGRRSPRALAAALAAARTGAGEGRIIAIHQPHLYSRTQLMAPRFAEAYERLADYTVVLDVDGAREDPVPGVTGALVSDAFTDQQKVAYLPDWQQAADRVAEVAREGDIVMTLSCGDVYRIIPQVLEALDGRANPG